MTTRYKPTNLRALWAAMHEAGHGLTYQGVDPALGRTPLYGNASLGLGESQSRSWENLVGRSLPFWRGRYAELQRLFPQLERVDLETWYRGINRVAPGLIRVDADEVTYSLHIILRFELEQQLVAGELALADLPEAWNARMQELLGVDVPDDTRGVLQDVHWTRAAYGYFPTYALGNALSVQIWRVVEQELPDLDAQLEAGEFRPLYESLRERLYRHGRKFTPMETLERAIGADAIDPQPYLEYLREKVGRLQSPDAMTSFQSVDSDPWRTSFCARRRSSRASRRVVRAELPEDAEIFDAHVHLGTDIDGMIGDFDELVAGQERYGISGAFMFCLDEPDRHPSFSAANDRTLAYAERSQGRFVPFARLDLTEEPIAEATRCLDAGARGIKLHPRAQKFHLNDERLAPVFELAAERGVPILIHGGRGLPPIADSLAELVERYDTQLIIAHCGIADLAALADCFCGRPGVFFDTSVWSPLDLLDLFRLVAPEQVLYASDYPYGQQPGSLLLAAADGEDGGPRRRASCARCSPAARAGSATARSRCRSRRRRAPSRSRSR